MGAQIGRWYLGLDWFDIVPYVNLIIIGLIGTLVSLTIYISWLVAQYRAPVAQAPGTN
jgi:hypothetical protein